MRPKWNWLLAVLVLTLPLAAVHADEYNDTIKMFQSAGQSGQLLQSAYGYAVFPSIGKGGAGIGGAHGSGRVYAQKQYIGDTKMTQLTVGLQLGGQVFSEMIFFADKRSLDEFTSGNFEFGAQATAVAITAGASANAGTTGASAGASAGQNNAEGKGVYHKGMAIFTVAKGGLMYEAAVGGQKFSYTPAK